MTADFVRLLRPTQWVKNLIVFAALTFSQRLFDGERFAASLAAFACFCALASAAYVWNDLHDASADRLHPQKRTRPIASGRVAPGSAVVLGAVLAASGLAIALAIGREFAVLAIAYVVLQIAYTLRLKNVVILDAMAIAVGFVLRAVGGGVAIDVAISPWLVICTFLLALFLAFSKRRHEIVLLDRGAAEHRASLAEYGPYFLDQMISVVTASTVVAYAIYTVSPEVHEKLHTDKLYLTVPFVLFGIFRYLYLIHQRAEGGNPTQLLVGDRPLWINIVLWIATAVWLLYA